MEKKVILILISLFILISIYADRSLLIDFHKLKANGNGYDYTKSLALDDPLMLDYTSDPDPAIEAFERGLKMGSIIGGDELW